MSDVIPLPYVKSPFGQYHNKLLTENCHCDVKRNLGKWGRLKTYIEYGNMYRLHDPYGAYHWTVQQTMNVEYKDKNSKHPYCCQVILTM